MSGMEPFLIAAAVASAAGTAVEGVSAYQAAGYQAKVMEAQAKQARQDAASEANLVLDDAARRIGTGVTIAAKGGGVDGSALDVLSDLGRQSMYEARRATTEGVTAGRNLDADAQQSRQQGKVALVSAGFKATSTLLSGAMQSRERRMQRQTRRPAYGGGR